MAQEQAKISLDTEIRFLKGVGPQRAEAFKKLGVRNAGDLIEYYPRNHQFMPAATKIKDLLAEHNTTVAGQIVNLRYNGRSRPPKMEMTIEDDTGQCRLVWFHGGYLRDKFLPEDKIAAWGKASQYKEITQIVNPKWIKIDDINQLENEQNGRAVYPASEELQSGHIENIIKKSLDNLIPLVEERYDKNHRIKKNLIDRKDAIKWIHQPPDQLHLEKAKRRLIYDELFLMQLAIAIRKERIRQTLPAWPLESTTEIDRRIRKLFPFEMTAAQNRAIGQICKDLKKAKPMNRLLQGDVGSGKTAVALYAALVAIARQYQVAIMAPTEILAGQHFQSIERYLKDSRVKRVVLTGGTTGKKRTELLGQISSGKIDMVVGTQALIQKDVNFNRLALVIIDEQHKFGVRQREKIRGKDIAPHYLVMTATPIPRTMAMTVFGDLDISVIDQLPPGRQEIITRWIEPTNLTKAYEFIRDRIKKGEQAYFVYPRVEETTETIGQNGKLDQEQIKAAVTEHKKLQEKIFAEFKVGLLHGQMEAKQKQQIMEQFRKGQINILVATVVIEVGLDVPNATIMVIEHAERYGLAQLHQLRGRIGRGKNQSYCLMFGQLNTDIATQRLEIMTQTNDGFKIAEEDLKIRGPGELLGTAQHGLPNIKIADIIRDIELLRMAQKDAFAMAKQDPLLQKNENGPLRDALKEQFGDYLGLVDVG